MFERPLREVVNFGALLEATARRLPRQTAHVSNGGALSWAEVNLRAGGVGRRRRARDGRAGVRIALVMTNGWPFVAALLGGLKAGATVAPLNPLLTDDERGRVLAHLRPKLVLDSIDDERADEASAPTTAPALVLYTSGSSGLPRGAVLSHQAVAFSSHSWSGPVMALTPDDKVLAVLPFSHSYGLNGALLAPLLAGASVVVLERFVPDDVLNAIARHRVTVFPAVATMFRRLLDSPLLAGADLSSLRLALSGAAPCPWELAKEWRRRTGVRILRGYGMTELFRPISYRADDAAELPDAIGRPVPGVQVRVVDDDRAPLPADQVGELEIRSPAVMDGYLDAPEDTRAVLEDGWFKTGDLVTLSAEGFVRIVGRKRELILRGGYSVFPAEVEAALLTHPAVGEAAVIGIESAQLGEEVVAFATLRAGAAARPDELIAHCKERLAAYKYPRHVVILDQLPKGATGKILKSRLASLNWTPVRRAAQP
jgi:long-chain acyl-CoA synthetase